MTLGPGDDLEMMQSPHLWPAHPVLPMKRRNEAKSANDVGILIDLDAMNKWAWVPGATMFETISAADRRIQFIEKIEPQKLQSIILDAGWVVD